MGTDTILAFDTFANGLPAEWTARSWIVEADQLRTDEATFHTAFRDGPFTTSLSLTIEANMRWTPRALADPADFSDAAILVGHDPVSKDALVCLLREAPAPPRLQIFQICGGQGTRS